MKSRYLVIAFMVGAFLLVLLGASLVPAPEALAVSYGASDPSAINATVNQTTTLYFDDFDDPNSGWLTGEDNNISLSYQSGEYEIKILAENWWGGSTPPLGDIFNYSVETEARLHAGSVGVYGLIFDRQDWENFYVFAVVPSRQVYAVLRHEPNDNWIALVSPTSSMAINAGSAINKLKVDREGDKITVYVNDQLLTTTNDNTFTGTSAEVGLFAQTLSVQPIETRFDYFLVEQIYYSTYFPVLFISNTQSPDAVPLTEQTGQDAVPLTERTGQDTVPSTERTGQGAGGIGLEP